MKYSLLFVSLLAAGAAAQAPSTSAAKPPSRPAASKSFDVFEASIPEMQAAMKSGRTTSHAIVQQYLTALSNKKLIIAGIRTELCIDTTCWQACSLEYEVTMVKNGHSSWVGMG